MKYITIEELQHAIQSIDGKHSLGAGALAEELIKYFKGLCTNSTTTYKELDRYDFIGIVREIDRTYAAISSEQLVDYILDQTGAIYITGEEHV